MADRTMRTPAGGRDYSGSPAGRDDSRSDRADYGDSPGTDYSRSPGERKAERRPAERKAERRSAERKAERRSAERKAERRSAEPREARERPVRGRRVADRSAGLALVGLATLIAGAWGGIAPYIGPAFGFKFSNLGSFQWTQANALLRLAPGAVAALAGLVLLVGGARLGGTRAGPWFWGLVTVLCGAWFVIGPAVWELLGNGNPIIQGLPSSTGTFINRIGDQLGEGLLLAFLGANAMGLVSRLTRTGRA